MKITDREQQAFQAISNNLLDLSEQLTMESGLEFFYLSDTETYELYRIGSPSGFSLHPQWNDYRGKKCYEILQGRDSPCPFCTNHLLSKDQYHIWQHTNELTGRTYILKDKLVEYAGKAVRLEVAIDSSDSDRMTQVLTETLQNQNLLSGSIQRTYAKDVDQVADYLLQTIARFYGADHGYIRCFGRPKEKQRYFSWSEIGPFRPFLDDNEELAEQWKKILTDARQSVVMDIETISDTQPLLYSYLQSRDVRSLCLTPILNEDHLLGMLVLFNLHEHLESLSMMHTLVMYLASSLRQEELEEENHRILSIDPVTGYQNYERFKQTASQILLDHPDGNYAVWYCDIKQFKYINDVFGYTAGDEVLKYMANVVSGSLREGEAFARVSGDSFCGLTRYWDVEELKDAHLFFSDLLASCPVLEGRDFKLEIAVGTYLYDSGEQLTLEEMIDRANMAQKNVKDLPGNQHGFYSTEMRARVLRDIQLKNSMAEAMRNREFILYLQPQIPLQQMEGDQPIRAEALVRWQKPDGTLIPPNVFIELFEHDGQITKLDYYILDEACRQFVRMQPLFSSSLRISVNISRITMLQPDFVQTCCQIKDRYQIPDGSIELEFTESVTVADYGVFESTIVRLKEAGFPCAMDDFGIGESSLNALKNLPLDVLKLDRMFFNDYNDRERGKTVVSFVLQMAQQLGMETVAEGIEQMEQVEELRQMGCGYVQGYVYSKPLPIAEFTERYADKK